MTMQKLEYRVWSSSGFTNEEIMKFLNTLGVDGWEHYLVDSHDRYYFRRPLLHSVGLDLAQELLTEDKVARPSFAS